ncbi:matrixin family metalloprotease [Trujillonella endophytica]|uniref:matrixin family metalloprotease n=1 Tax=Trujillonella endophytica TaxID=673521 RepID=UPI001FCD2F2D|nr:matrixin family metalloprotease [Trujillella endophytica]
MLLAGAVVLAAVVVDPRGVGSSVAADGRPINWPTPGFEMADAPLGTPPPAAGDGSYVFVAQQQDGDRPVAYDPCRPIHYVIRPDNAPPGADSLVHEAFARVSTVTGLQFTYDGATDEGDTDDREPFQPDRYGDRWAPVLVSWQTEIENPEFATDVAGMAGSTYVEPTGGPRVFVSGMMALDATAFALMLADPAGIASARAIVLHELGHLVGLAHVPDQSQIMYRESTAVADFAPGDLSGLAQLGQGDCVPGV